MDYNLVVPQILCNIFESNIDINKKDYINYYSQIYNIINNLDKREIINFEEKISKYLYNFIKILLSNINSNLDNYFEIYDIYLEKSYIADNVFMYYHNLESNKEKKNKIISYYYNNLWNEIILIKLYPKIIDDIKLIKNMDDSIFYKLETYNKHTNSLNKNLNQNYKDYIFNIIKYDYNINLNKILDIITYYEKILKIFDDNKSYIYLKKQIKTIILENSLNINDNINDLFIDLKNNLQNNDLETYKMYSKFHKLLNYLDNTQINKYLYILQNIINQNTFVNIEILIKNINIADYMLKYLLPNIYSNITSNELFLEKSIEQIKSNFDNNFNIELVKYINKNINSISLVKNINIIINNLENKEIFIVYYKNALKSRLLNCSITNLNNESYLLNILMSNNNLIDVSTMLIMLKDYQKSIIYSQEFNSLFNNRLIDKILNKVFINLTTYDIWNITPYNCDDELIHNEFKVQLRLVKDNFKTYYRINNSNKNVKFVDNLSSCFIDFNNIELECNYLQANILYLFNINDHIDLNKIDISKNLLLSFIKPKILVKKNNKLYINDKFSCTPPFLKLNKLYKSIKLLKNKNTDTNIDTNIDINIDTKIDIDKDKLRLIFRKEEYIDSSIMKILKKNKDIYMRKNYILEEVKKVLNNKFVVSEELFNKRIDHLNDKMYLEINENTIKYLT